MGFGGHLHLDEAGENYTAIIRLVKATDTIIVDIRQRIAGGREMWWLCFLVYSAAKCSSCLHLQGMSIWPQRI